MKDRLAFERWLSDKGMAANYAGDGEYDSPRVQLAWEAWFEVSEQARALLAVRDAELEAIGAGGVSSQRITGTDALQSKDKEDAERYRWLCDKFGITKLPCAIERIIAGDVYVADGKAGIDAAIDNARYGRGTP